MLLSLGKRVFSACWGSPESSGVVRRPQAQTACACRRRTALWPLLQSEVTDCFGLSDVGRVRLTNEDQLLITDGKAGTACGNACRSKPESCASVLLVADGVGGSAGGEHASQLAIQCVARHLSELPVTFAAGEERDEQITEGLKAALVCAQQRIRREAQASPRLVRMGTTLTLAYITWPTAYIAHIGDSRAYLFDDGDLTQLTQDQTIAQMLADVGAIDADRVPQHPYHNILGSVLSADHRQFLPSIQKVPLRPGSQLLLCTDGLTKYLDRIQIGAVLRSAATAEDACRELIDAANEAGGSDNITVVLARFGRDPNGDASAARERTSDCGTL